MDVESKFALFGGNTFFIEKGEGTCRLKSSSNPGVSDSGLRNGKIMVKLDPSAVYSANVVVECLDQWQVEESNSFLVEVKCGNDVANLKISEVLTKGNSY